MINLKDAEIIKEYLNGKSSAKVGKEFGIANSTVLAILRRNSIEIRSKGGINKLPEDKIIELYSNGNTMFIIAEKFNVSLETIRKILLKNEVHIRSMQEYKNPNLEINYFETINSAEKAYFLGFLLTDGYIKLPDIKNGHNQCALSLQLNKTDKYIIEKFKNELHSNNKIINCHKDCCELRIYNDKLVNDLNKYGIVYDKNNRTYFPKLDINLMPHLIRGLIDGDGWITHHNKPSTNKIGNAIGLCGNYSLIESFKIFLINTLKISDVKITIRNEENNFSQILWCSKSDIEKIGNYIYRDKKDIYLTRKYKKFISILDSNLIPR